MKRKIIIFGYGYTGVKLYRKLENNEAYSVIGFADNSLYKQGMYVDNQKVRSMDDLIKLKEHADFGVIIAAKEWYIIGQQLEERDIRIEGIFIDEEILPYEVMDFEKLDLTSEIKLYAGDICDDVHMKDKNLYGLSITKADKKHILHDITYNYPLPDNCIASYQAEDVLEHIALEKVIPVINEIYRILKPGAIFRICLPDYYSPYLKKVSMMDINGNIIYDPTGGGVYGKNGVENGGHMWFPNYHKVKEILKQTKFKKIEFVCYHMMDETLCMKDIDFSKGFIRRVTLGEKQNIYSMVIDCYK